MSISDTTVPPSSGMPVGGVAHLAAGMIAPAMKRVNISQILAQSGSAATLRLDQVRLGRATINRVNVEGVNATLDAGDTRLEGFRMVLRVTVGIRFRVFGISRSRSLTFGFPVDVGTVTIPRLDDIAVQVPTAIVTGTEVEIQPVDNLDFGGGQFTDLRIEETALPAAGFGLGGLDLGEVRLRDVAVPATWTETVSIGSFSPAGPLRLPRTVVTGIELPRVDVPRVSSSAPIEVENIRPPEQSAGVDLIILGITLFVQPIVDVEIAALTINDIQAASSISRIGLQDISAPVTLNGLRLGGVELNEVTVNRITV